MSDQPRSGAEILADLHAQPVRSVVVHICMRPALIDEWEKANDELIKSQSEDSGKQRLGNGGVSAKTRKAAERVREVEEQIAAADVAFTFQKLDKTRHSEIMEENPPREGNLLDYQVGYNREAVDNAVVLESLVDPVFETCDRKKCKHDTCGTWEALLKVIGPGEWQEMVNGVREVGGAVTSAPKSGLASRILDRPASGSGRRARGA